MTCESYSTGMPRNDSNVISKVMFRTALFETVFPLRCIRQGQSLRKSHLPVRTNPFNVLYLVPQPLDAFVSHDGTCLTCRVAFQRPLGLSLNQSPSTGRHLLGPHQVGPYARFGPDITTTEIERLLEAGHSCFVARRDRIHD